jgi:hypothetical protein
MIYKRPLRLTILHLAQRFLMDEETFIMTYSFSLHFFRQPKLRLYLGLPFASRLTARLIWMARSL